MCESFLRTAARNLKDRSPAAVLLGFSLLLHYNELKILFFSLSSRAPMAKLSGSFNPQDTVNPFLVVTLTHRALLARALAVTLTCRILMAQV